LSSLSGIILIIIAIVKIDIVDPGLPMWPERPPSPEWPFIDTLAAGLLSLPYTQKIARFISTPQRVSGILLFPLGSQSSVDTMRFSTSAVLVTVLGWIGATTAHNIQLRAHSRECFHETLHKDDQMTVTFQVGDREFGGSGNLEIDFWV
jgi:hypothetical protein